MSKLRDKIEKSLNRFRFYSGIGWNFLSNHVKETLERNAKSIQLPKKKVLFRQGSTPRGIYILRSGKLKVYQTNYDGSIQILFIYSADELFGYRPLLSDELQPVSVAALEDCELMFIEKEVFLDLLKHSHTLNNQLLVSLCHEFTVLINRMNVFAQRGIKERLALALLLLNEKYASPNDKEGVAEIIITRTDLANFVGTSLENIVRTMNYFRERKLIHTVGKSIFIDHFENLFILSAIE
jgi:CRP-like cAMP-binding protein